MENNEVKILYEIIVKYDKDKFDTKLTITDKTIKLEKKKGLFKKIYKIIDLINIEDIKVLNDKVQVKNKNTRVEVETNNKIYKVTCNNIIEAKKLTEEIIKFKTGNNLLERTTNKVVKIAKIVEKTVVSVGAIAYIINENKKEILEAVEAIKEMINKQ